MTFQDFEALCKQRRSIRYFSDVPVRIDDVMQLLDVAHLAPSVENIQPWRFHVIVSPDLKKQITECSCYGNFVAGSSVFVIVTCDRTAQSSAVETIWNPQEMEYSCMAAMMQLILAATAKGMGSCWVSLHHGNVHEILNLPISEKVIGGIMLGNYKSGEEQSTDHHARKALKEIVTMHQ